jgi:hypothetical protein
MTDSGNGFGLPAPANERTDTRLHSRVDLVRRSALPGGRRARHRRVHSRGWDCLEVTDIASPMSGPVAFGTSARSAVLTDWPASGYVGIHGTDRPNLLPAASHMAASGRDKDILRLSRLMPVGTPITIR